MNNQFNYIPVYSEIAAEKKINSILESYNQILTSAGGNQIVEIKEIDKPICFFVLTGGTENYVQEIVDKQKSYFENNPIYIIAHSSDNSLPASLEILAKLQQEGKSGEIFYLANENDETGIKKIKEAINFLQIKNDLEKSKIGMVGTPSDWLIASSPNFETFKSNWGPKIVNIEMAEITNRLEELKLQENNPTDLSASAEEIIEADKNDIRENELVFEALNDITKKNNLDAVSIRCFDLVLNQKTTGCFALSQLNDDGIIAGCEGDLVSTLGMLLANKLTGNQVWMANPSRINIEKSQLVLAHCTVPRNMVNTYNVRSHFESGLGVGLEGKLPTGDVTIFRLGGKDIDKIWFAEGTIIPSENDDNLCRTQATVELNDNSKLEELLTKPLGNHLLMVYGSHAETLEKFLEFKKNK